MDSDGNRLSMSSVFADLLTNSLPNDPDSENDDPSTLPFPQPLSRQLFSTPDFNTEQFLVSYAQFRTLDDLRSELRTWVDKLEVEMDTLIEEDWKGYLSLGRALAGGEAVVKDAERKVRQVDRELQNAKRRIEERIKEVDDALREKAHIRVLADLARQLLAVHSTLQELEKGLQLRPDDFVAADEMSSLDSTERLRQLVSRYRELISLIAKIPRDHPFLRSQSTRIEKIKSTLKGELQDAFRYKGKERNSLQTFHLLTVSSCTDLLNIAGRATDSLPAPA